MSTQIKLKVAVICEDCSDENRILEMETVDKLAFNRERLTQYQKYKCPICGNKVAVLIEPSR